MAIRNKLKHAARALGPGRGSQDIATEREKDDHQDLSPVMTWGTGEHLTGSQPSSRVCLGNGQLHLAEARVLRRLQETRARRTQTEPLFQGKDQRAWASYAAKTGS